MMHRNEMSGCIGLFMADAVTFSAMTADVNLIPVLGFCFSGKDHKKGYN